MRKEIYLKNLGAQIVKLRKERNMSQAELAHRCNKDPQSLERVENGKTNPTSFYLYEIALGLEVEISELFSFLK